jgi:hypothetical protein
LNITGIYHEKRVTIISASIPIYVDGIRGYTTQAFPGATIGINFFLKSEVPAKFKCNSSLGAYKEESGRLFNKKKPTI